MAIRGMAWLAAALVLLAIVGTPFAAAQTTAPESHLADPVDWGVYAKLAGASAQGSGKGYRLHWRWINPGHVLVEEWFDPGTGALKHTHTITPRGKPGELLLKASYMGGKEWFGTVQPDGSVLYVGQGLLKSPYLARINEANEFEQLLGKLVDGRLVETYSASYARFALISTDAPGEVATAAVNGPAPTALQTMMPTATAMAVPAEPDVAGEPDMLDPADWGVYAQLVGHTSSAPNQMRWRYWPEFKAISEESGNGMVELIGRGRPGQLVKQEQHREVGGWEVPQRGIIQPDGSVLWAKLEPFPWFHRLLGLDEAGRMRYEHFDREGKRATNPPWPIRRSLVPSRDFVPSEDLHVRVQQIAGVMRKRVAGQYAYIAEFNRKREKNERSSRRLNAFNNAMNSAYGVLSEAREVAAYNEAQSRSDLDATLARINAQAAAERRQQSERAAQGSAAGQEPVAAAGGLLVVETIAEAKVPLAGVSAATTPTPVPSAAATTKAPDVPPGQPLKFILTHPLATVLNAQNAMCFSNVVTIAGPPGWPKSQDTTEARALIARYYEQFKAKCAAVAPLSGEVDFSWNRFDADLPSFYESYRDRRQAEVSIR